MQRSAIRAQCDGEAHSNHNIDNCSICMPYWGHFFLCPSCYSKLDDTAVCRNGECLSGGKRFFLE